MDILSIIEKKKNKIQLSQSEIDFFVNEYTVTNTIPDYQASAFLMAITINGMSDNELFYLTNAMLKTGKIINFSRSHQFIIDKHSTGGVGDKVSLILAPICVALGLKVAKLSGKGLGHTGGTIDKLAAGGINTNLNKEQYFHVFNKAKMFVISQTKEIVPADKKIYMLRNLTATVASLPLIAASIVSKKLSLNTDFVFLDVKVGEGAFCTNINEANLLSQLMIKLFRRFNRKVIIHITDMSQPLGTTIGNAIELKSSLEFLKGNPENEQLKELIYNFVSDILIATKLSINKSQSYQKINSVIANRKAYDVFLEWATAQGAKKEELENQSFFFPKYSYKIKSTKVGFISYNSAKEIGLISFILGAGRATKEDNIDYHAGILLNKTYNDFVKRGELIGTLYSSNPIKKEVADRFIKNIIIYPNKQKPLKPIIKIIK